MAKFEVTLYYHTSATIVVEADSEEEALNKSYNMDINDQLIEGLTSDDDPDIHELTTEEFEYKGDKIVRIGERYTAYAFTDDDCEDIVDKEFYSLYKAKNWLDQVHGREVHDE